MYKVLFAEDELLVRLGLQKSIPWENFSMELTALADNGLEALRMFEEIRPDVVITDIRMDGMDGVELVRRIRLMDEECAVVVISCIDDFETLRKLIPYKLNGYVLKASISIEEICGVLGQVKDYLIKTGRTAEDIQEDTKSLEESISDYLQNKSRKLIWDNAKQMHQLLLFELKAEDKDKINELAMEFIYELVNRQMPGGTLIPLKEKEFCLYFPEKEKNIEEKVQRVNHSIEGFLGVQFQVMRSKRQGNESIKEWFDRTYAEQSDRVFEGNGWNPLIQKSVTYMRKHHQESLSLTEISHVIGISSSYFSHLFKQQTGKNYVEYLNEIRLEEAVKELRGTDEKIAVISQRHGFQNLEYFSRFFKRKMGVSPAKWRQKNQ